MEQVEKAEPISAHPDKLKEQLGEGQAILEDLDQRLAALQAVKNTADELLVHSGMEDDAAQGKGTENEEENEGRGEGEEGMDLTIQNKGSY